MATWLITAALSTAIVGFVWLIVLAFRGGLRGCRRNPAATSGDGGFWMYPGGDSSHSSGHHHDDAGGCDSGSDGGGSDGGGGDGGGGD